MGAVPLEVVGFEFARSGMVLLECRLQFTLLVQLDPLGTNRLQSSSLSEVFINITCGRGNVTTLELRMPESRLFRQHTTVWDRAVRWTVTRDNVI